MAKDPSLQLQGIHQVSFSQNGIQWSVAVPRFFLGVVFCLFGLNGFLHFIPEPKDSMPPAAAHFVAALLESGFMLPLIAGTQVVVGVLLLMDVFVPLALVLIAPIIVGILGFHLFLAPSTILPGMIVLLLELYLVWRYQSAFRPMLSMKVVPG